MKVSVTAKPNSKNPGITKIDANSFIVAVKEPPIQGKANQAIVKALAEYFNKTINDIRLVNGFSSKQKIFEIKD